MNKFFYLSLFFLFLFSWVSNSYAQDNRNQSKKLQKQTDTSLNSNVVISSRLIQGKIRSQKTGELLPLATILQAGTQNGTQSDEEGNYSLKIDLSKPQLIVCIYFGFANDTARVSEESSTLNFSLNEKFFTIKDIVVSVSRKNERKFESPVTIETLSAREIQLNNSLNLYERMATLTSVNVITTSLNFKTINTRGFNSSYNTRFIQRYDNMDLSMPGFNVAVGILNGPIDLDVERVELIPGANSALYGPNAINGLMNITSKSPFVYPGLSVNVKSGINHIDGIDHAPGPVNDFSMRYAKVFNPKFASKITIGYQKANDWHGTDYRDVGDYYLSENNGIYGYKRGPGNPGYDGVSVGGDEVATIFDTSMKAPIVNMPFLPKGPLRVARTGYKEEDLFSYKPYSFKTDIGFFYKPNPGTEISWTTRLSKGSSTFQIANRAQIKDFFLQQHKIEIKGKNYSARAYCTFENIGETFDFSLAAININRAAKSDDNWFTQYLLAYSGFYNNLADALGLDTIERGNDASARKFADSDNSNLYNVIKSNFGDTLANLITGKERYQPGTAAFDSIFQKVRTTPFKDGGASLTSFSKTYYGEILYDFTPYIKRISLTGGVNYRLHSPHTVGTVFQDATKPIYSNELGAFIQLGKNYLDERLRVQGSARLDILQRFNPRFSPRVSLVYMAGEKRQHSFRLSAQVGFRMPTLMDQFFYMNIPGVVTFGGFIQDAKDLNLVIKSNDGSQISNVYTLSSVNSFLISGDSNKLIRPTIRNISPEELRTAELGWRTFLLEKLETDLNFYFVSFRNLINTEEFIGPANGIDTINAAYVKNRQMTKVFRRAVNSTVPLNSIGISVSLNYYFNKKWTWFGNYNMNTLLNNKDYNISFVTAFNTPKNKVNLGFKGNNIFKGLGIGSNFQWVDSYYFKEYTRSGIVDAYYNLDLNLNYMLPKQKIMLKLGGTNITNNRYIQALGSPNVGAIYYFSILYDTLLN